ncbi:MAG: hypothetical protein ACC651_15085 [Candidatus Scalindua sp.]
MDKKFLMGANDWLVRSKAEENQPTAISPKLRKNLVMLAMRKAYDFYSNFFVTPLSKCDFDNLFAEFERDYSHARSLDLLVHGGVREKDYLILWCLSHMFLPEVYVESGVFVGSSLHAFINSPRIKKILAIDPNLSNLRIPKQNIPDVEFINDKDFSQLETHFSGMRSLVFFDDHIDTASRILQAFEKGFRYVLFDDSTGLEGICQRLYPAVPTIPMIMNIEIYSPGDELSWIYKAAGYHVRLVITQELIEKCIEAKSVVKKYDAIPDLGEFIPQPHPEAIVDKTKFIVELDQP